jgi:glucokinase
MKKALRAGIDLGGTKVAVGVVNEKGEILAQNTYPTQVAGGFQAVADQMVKQVKEACESAGVSAKDLASAGVAAAGQIELGTGKVLFAPNLGWHDAPLGQYLSDQLGVAVGVDNDVRAASLGEYLHGVDKRPESFFNIYYGTGVGAGYVLHGVMLRGAGNAAGEIGHITINHHGPKCKCGNHGCLELYASGTGLARRSQSAVKDQPEVGARLIELAGGPDKVNAHTVRQAAEEGDPLARQLVRETGHFAGIGIANIVNLFNPDVVMIGGGLTNGLGKAFTDEAFKAAHERALKSAMKETELVVSKLGTRGAIIGAACLGMLDKDAQIITD